MAKNARAQNIFTPECRGSFVHLHSFENDPATGTPSNKHSITMLFPKQSADWRADLPWLAKNLMEVLQMQFPGYQGMPPAFQDPNNAVWPVKDGDLPNTRGNSSDGHPGNWVVRAASTLFDAQVNLLDGSKGELGLMTQANCRSGDYFELQVNGYYYDKGGNMGIGVGLNNAKWVRSGEPLGGGGTDAAGAWGVQPVQSAAAAAFAPPAAPVGAAPAFPAPVAPVAPVAALPVPIPAALVAPAMPAPVAPMPVTPAVVHAPGVLPAPVAPVAVAPAAAPAANWLS
jgi:hypothetical protein